VSIHEGIREKATQLGFHEAEQAARMRHRREVRDRMGDDRSATRA
jgi:hypothetical protein